jgi:ligand-binding sensor domain-containing protein
VAADRSVGLMLAVMFLPAAAFGLNPSLLLTQYVHTNWTTQRGFAIPPVDFLAQTPSGYLWLGTGSRLFRFDGVRFLPVTLTGDQAGPFETLGLRAASPGGIWSATNMGIGRFDEQGHLLQWSYKRPFQRARVRLLQDHLQRLWIGTNGPGSRGLIVVDRTGGVHEYVSSEALPGGGVLSMSEDARGSVWVATNGSICHFENDMAPSCIENMSASAVAMVDEGDGGMLLVDARSQRVLRLSAGKLSPVIGTLDGLGITATCLLRDRDGNVWIGTQGHGLIRLFHGEVHRITRREGLSSDNIGALLEDSEGNLWVGTGNGLDRFRDPKIHHISTVEGLSNDLVTAVQVAHDGTLWFGTAVGVDHRIGHRVFTYRVKDGLPGSQVTALYEDSRQVLWAATLSGTARLVGERFVPVRGSRGESLDRVTTITGDPKGNVWLADLQKGLFYQRRGQFEFVRQGAATDAKSIYPLLAGPNGELWLGYYQGGIAQLRAGAVKLYRPEEGLAPGWIQSIYLDCSGVLWVGAKTGLSRYRNGRWTTWTARSGIPEGGIQGIIEDDRSDLWVLASEHLLQIPRLQVDHSPDGTPTFIQPIAFGDEEGIRISGMGMATQRLAKSRDGVIWVSTPDGLAYVDPQHIPANHRAPPVVIETVNGRAWNGTSTAVDFDTHTLNIEYTALSLSQPEKVRFRYMLEGHDSRWSESFK